MRRTGDEPFHADGSALPFDVLSFWQWYASDLAGNALRGCIAEYLVLQALGAKPDVRQEWDAVDIRLTSGLTVEVKSAAYHQSWAQRKEYSIGFSMKRLAVRRPSTSRLRSGSIPRRWTMPA